MPGKRGFKRKALTPGVLYRILSAELHARRAYRCACRFPIPFVVDVDDGETANWRIARPRPCDQGCDALIAEIARTALLAFDVSDPAATRRAPGAKADVENRAKVGADLQTSPGTPDTLPRQSRPPLPESRGSAPMTPVGWEERVDLCDTDDEVIQVARDFLARLEPWEVSLLPVPCKPPKLLTARDISEYAFEVVCWERDHSDRSLLVTKMATFLARASIRLSQIAMAGANDSAGGTRESA